MSHAIPHTGKKQQTGGWNSGAVALPAMATANTFIVFLYSRNGCAKEEVKRTRSAS